MRLPVEEGRADTSVDSREMMRVRHRASGGSGSRVISAVLRWWS